MSDQTESPANRSSPNATDVGPVCNDAGGNALAWMFGLGNFTNSYGIDGSTGKEDLGSSKFFFFLGTNQAETIGRCTPIPALRPTARG